MNAYRLLKRLVPAPLQDSLYQPVLNLMRQKFGEQERAMPAVALEARHIAHLRPLVDRAALLDTFPQGGVAAEIGVDQGDFSAEILRRTRPQKLHLIDIWGSARYHDGKRLHVEERFGQEIAAGQVEINRGLSTGVLPTFQDHYFDWVYIDTDHSYRTTADELRLCARKVKPGGIIAGHDYTAGSWVGLVRYGVIEAVHAFCVQEGWELIHVTMETRGSASFAIRQMR
ncbi:MAG: class I SAM-dependent methyltransferase [Bacteroidia bacterium]|nr:class I SAM-dependent methyltransferase [Bacteroidia bacterium]